MLIGIKKIVKWYLRELIDLKSFRYFGIFITVLGLYDTFGSHLLSTSLQSEMPKLYDVLEFLTDLMPWWDWILLIIILSNCVIISRLVEKYYSIEAGINKVDANGMALNRMANKVQALENFFVALDQLPLIDKYFERFKSIAYNNAFEGEGYKDAKREVRDELFEWNKYKVNLKDAHEKLLLKAGVLPGSDPARLRDDIECEAYIEILGLMKSHAQNDASLVALKNTI